MNRRAVYKYISIWNIQQVNFPFRSIEIINHLSYQIYVRNISATGNIEFCLSNIEFYPF